MSLIEPAEAHDSLPRNLYNIEPTLTRGAPFSFMTCLLLSTGTVANDTVHT